MLRDLFSLFPAYAGVIPGNYGQKRKPGAFPRIRGGDPTGMVIEAVRKELFPAYAGVILLLPLLRCFLLAFPRIRGGDP